MINTNPSTEELLSELGKAMTRVLAERDKREADLNAIVQRKNEEIDKLEAELETTKNSVKHLEGVIHKQAEQLKAFRAELSKVESRLSTEVDANDANVEHINKLQREVSQLTRERDRYKVAYENQSSHNEAHTKRIVELVRTRDHWEKAWRELNSGYIDVLAERDKLYGENQSIPRLLAELKHINSMLNELDNAVDNHDYAYIQNELYPRVHEHLNDGFDWSPSEVQVPEILRTVGEDQYQFINYAQQKQDVSDVVVERVTAEPKYPSTDEVFKAGAEDVKKAQDSERAFTVVVDPPLGSHAADLEELRVVQSRLEEANFLLDCVRKNPSFLRLPSGIRAAIKVYLGLDHSELTKESVPTDTVNIPIDEPVTVDGVDYDRLKRLYAILGTTYNQVYRNALSEALNYYQLAHQAWLNTREEYTELNKEYMKLCEEAAVKPGEWRTGTKNPHTLYFNDRPIGCIFDVNDTYLVMSTLGGVTTAEKKLLELAKRPYGYHVDFPKPEWEKAIFDAINVLRNEKK